MGDSEELCQQKQCRLKWQAAMYHTPDRAYFKLCAGCAGHVLDLRLFKDGGARLGKFMATCKRSEE